MRPFQRRVLVPGASNGIGEAIAQAFAAEGAEVVATGATQDEINRAAANAANAQITFKVLDVRDDSGRCPVRS